MIPRGRSILERLLDRLLAIGGPGLGLRVETCECGLAVPGLTVTRLSEAGLSKCGWSKRALSEAGLAKSALPVGWLTESQLLTISGLLAEARLTVRGSGSEGAIRISLRNLHRQLVSELVDRYADLLGHCTLDRDLLRKLAECLHDLVRRESRADDRACRTPRMARKRVQKRIVRKRIVCNRAL